MSKVRVAVVGDYNDQFAPHTSIATAPEHAGTQHQEDEVAVAWVPSDAVTEDRLVGAAGIWIAPGSPFKSMAGALDAVSYGRRGGTPTLGTCGGYQYVAIEYARRVLGMTDADHAEHDPYASVLFISALSCSLTGQRLVVQLVAGSHAASHHGTESAQERYHCTFGLTPRYQTMLHNGGLRVASTDHDGEARILELPDHPFFIATLFVPQTSSTPLRPADQQRTAATASCDRRIPAGRRPPPTNDRSRGRADPVSETDVSTRTDAERTRVAVLQAASVPFDQDATLDRLETVVAEAAAAGAQLVVAPEAFLGGYPQGLTFAAVLGARATSGHELYRRYWAGAVDIPGLAFDRIAATAARHRIYLVTGVVERVGGTLYCTVLFLGPSGKLLGQHRKLVPTGSERLVWGRGDGSTLPVIDTPVGPHGSRRANPRPTRAAAGDLDLHSTVRGHFDLDVNGHYARPDLFRWTVDQTARDGVPPRI